MTPVIITYEERQRAVGVPLSKYYHGVANKYGLHNIVNGMIDITYNRGDQSHTLVPYVDSKGWTTG